MVHPWGFVNSRWDPNGAPFGFSEFAEEPTFGRPRGLQIAKVASPLGEQGAYKSQKS